LPAINRHLEHATKLSASHSFLYVFRFYIAGCTGTVLFKLRQLSALKWVSVSFLRTNLACSFTSSFFNTCEHSSLLPCWTANRFHVDLELIY